MPRQRIHHGRIVYVMPDDFPERLKRLKEESGLSWAEIARRIGTSPYTLWRWVEAGVRPHWRHQMALLALAEDLGLAGPPADRVDAAGGRAGGDSRRSRTAP